MSISGLTFDTGVLIALERRKERAWRVYREAINCQVVVTVPAAVIAEWWRGRTNARVHVRSGLVAERLSEEIARLAGEAMAKVEQSTIVDAIVMASAALRGDAVYTSDVDDLLRLQAFFPGVRVLGV